MGTFVCGSMRSFLLGLLVFILAISINGPKCQLPTFKMEAFERQGDILIGGLFPVHLATSSGVMKLKITFTQAPNPLYCQRSGQHQQPPYLSGPANRSLPNNPSSLSFWFYKYIQTMVFAINEINQDSGLLPNITLGFQIFDSCQTVPRALLGSLQFLTGTQTAIPNFHCQHTQPRAGLIAEAGIIESRTIAGLLDLYRFPQISYFATGPVTNTGSQFPSFFRTLPSNRLQALGLAQLVIHFAWTWVGLLTTDSEYGKQGMEIVREEIVKKGVCPAFSALLDAQPNVNNIGHIANIIMESQARVIVTFCGSEAQPLLLQLSDHRAVGRVWLCSEAMSHITIFRNKKALSMLSGSLAISSHKEQVPGLRDFILHLHPSRSPEDIFIQEFWSKVFKCQWNSSSAERRNHTKPCTGKESLQDGVNQFVSMPGFGLAFNVHNAVYAVAHALHGMVQNEPSRRKEALVKRMPLGRQGYNPWRLVQYLRRVHFKNTAGEQVFFDEHGDPPALFDIINTRFCSAHNFCAARVGRILFSPSGSEANELKIDRSTIMWPEGSAEIPISVCTPSCPQGHHKSHRSNKVTCCFDCAPCANGEISNQTDSSACSKCLEDQWPDEGQAKCVPKEELFTSFHEPLGLSLASASIGGSLLPFMVLALFMAHHRTPLVRANNSELSYLLLAGLTLSFLCCLLFLGRPTHTTCLLRQVVFGMTFALCLSCLLAKTLVVVAAFSATVPGSYMRLVLSTQMPRAMILVGCLSQLLLCIGWLAASPPTVERDTHSIPYAVILFCHDGSPVAFWGMLAYLAVLAGLSLTGAFLARNLPETYNEARLICFSLLGCLGVWLAFVPAYLTSREHHAAATEAFAILASSSALLCGMFLPKCYILLLRPELNTRRLLMRRERPPDM